jgi:hypothetical protein
MFLLILLHAVSYYRPLQEASDEGTGCIRQHQGPCVLCSSAKRPAEAAGNASLDAGSNCQDLRPRRWRARRPSSGCSRDRTSSPARRMLLSIYLFIFLAYYLFLLLFQFFRSDYIWQIKKKLKHLLEPVFNVHFESWKEPRYLRHLTAALNEEEPFLASIKRSASDVVTMEISVV